MSGGGECIAFGTHVCFGSTVTGLFLDRGGREWNSTMPQMQRRYHFTYQIGYPPMFTDPNDPWIKQVVSAANEVADRNIDIAGAQGSLDVAYAVKIARQPVSLSWCRKTT